jgi:hypothetical protein
MKRVRKMSAKSAENKLLDLIEFVDSLIMTQEARGKITATEEDIKNIRERLSDITEAMSGKRF